MPKAIRAKTPKPSFYCSACGNESARWFGRCPACEAWNTAVEAPVAGAKAQARSGRSRWAPAGQTASATSAPKALADVDVRAATRQPTGFGELDRVLGGGVVSGGLVLIGGDPGIGKSTLLLQMAASLSAQGGKILVVSGEESQEQVRLRAERLGAVPSGLLIFCETDLEAVLQAVEQVKPDLVIIDSIQTLARAEVEGGPGSVSQVRECGLALLHLAKGTSIPVFLVGHVTKEGSVAGPRVLEHMVDAVLYLEGERYQHYRVLRAAKNRFGSTHELGVFEMTGAGLQEVANPSQAFLAESTSSEPGSAVVASLEGSRPLLVEVQSLVATSFYATPQRVTNGFDQRRLAVLLAVLERRVGLKLGRHDVFVTVTGGLKLEDPGTDLGVALAVASSYKSRPMLDKTLALGEVSLSGEVRRVSRVEIRAREAAQLGFERVGVPRAQAAEAQGAGVEVVPLKTVREAFDLLLGAPVKRERPRTERPADSASGRR